jgi:serine/threonine protein kinase
VSAVAGSPTAAWLPKRPEQAPADVSGPRFAKQQPSHADPRLGEAGRPTHGSGRATRPFRFGSENRPDPDPPLGVGSVIGDRYQILGLLGEGGMGRVYEAQHIVLRRRVALKLLRRDAEADAENLARFRQEALAASRIGAPEIVEVVDFASHPVAGGQQTYMVMELLAGESLEDWMDRNARLDEGLATLASLCDGLAAAHRAAVVHRDIKPANVFLPSPDATRANQVRVKILDFGIAKITAGSEGFQTRQGSLLGTPYYLAPERVMGAELTGAADLYSVGVILYEMLTGNVPFVADSFMGILANHVHTQPLDPRQAAPDRAIPAAVAQLCMRLLDKQPQLRPSAEQVAEELRSLLARESSSLAIVEIGPRGETQDGGDTRVIAERTRELAMAEPPAQPLIVGARSGTQIGHASMASSSAPIVAVPPSVVVSVPSKSAGVGRGLAIGLSATLAAAAIATLAWWQLRDEDRATVEPPALVQEDPPTEVAAEPKPVEAPAPKPEPIVEAASDPKPVEPTVDSEREPREAVTTEDRKRDRSKPKSDATSKPAEQPNNASRPGDRAELAPAPEPVVEPPQPDPPTPTPKPGEELPTIKDDVYDELDD